jgi:integrase
LTCEYLDRLLLERIPGLRVAGHAILDHLRTAMTAKPYIVVPAALRRRYGLEPGDRCCWPPWTRRCWLRCLYRRAEEDGLIGEKDNPALKVPKPRRLPSTRQALADSRLAEINQVAATTGDDPELDALILRLRTETACRRGGALALRPLDLDPEQCLVRLWEKGETERWQPVSPTLMAALVRHAAERHAPPNGQLLRYRAGRPITHRRSEADGAWCAPRPVRRVQSVPHSTARRLRLAAATPGPAPA